MIPAIIFSKINDTALFNHRFELICDQKMVLIWCRGKERREGVTPRLRLKGILFQLRFQIYQRAGNSLIKLYERVGKPIIHIFRKNAPSDNIILTLNRLLQC